MPIETNSVGIRPVGRPQTSSSTEGVTRREDGSSSGFSPKTNVSIKNAVNDMTGILSKISANQQEGMERLPENLQKVIQNVMKQAFSMNETLAQGIGSTLESQRFSMEQLAGFSRMLSQMAVLSEKGYSMEISDQMQALLTNLKSYLTEQEGSVFEPVLLNKMAFELLDTKTAEELPQALYEMLSQLQMAGGSSVPQTNTEGSSFQFLKQLVQFFMPRPAGGGDGAQPNTQQSQQGSAQQGVPQQGPQAGQQGVPQQGPQAGQQGVPQQGPQAGQQSVPQQGPQAGQQSVPQQGPQAGQQGMPQQGPQAGQQGMPQQGPQAGQQGVPQQGPQAGQQGMPQQGPQAGQQGMPQQGPQAGQQGVPQQGPQGSQQQMPQQGTQQSQQGRSFFGENPQMARQNGDSGMVRQGTPQGLNNSQWQGANETQNQQPSSQNLALQHAREQLLQQPMQNTAQTMQTMKSLAQLLLKNAEMTQQDTMMLQNFVNGKETLMSENDARHLQNLLRLCQQNVPATVQQAAIQQNIPDLPRLWAFMQLCDMAFAKNLKGRDLKRASRDVADFVTSMRHSMGGENSSVRGQRSMNFMIPLFLGMGDNEVSYPSYIHVYDENVRDQETNIEKKETWLRLCVLTDNIGAVELTCRVYEENHLDMRVFFSSHEVANDFREYVPELKGALRESSLKLEDFKIGAVGERRFL